ncbi:MAG: MBL fold metallo-hydrolase, partial [Acidobacteria bacterium]|nr:MBL fold metallo-hydrolase [Acidobacteriota bacterium]
MRIIPISIPTPFYVGDVNVYLIREDPITLIDVGPKTAEAEKALSEGLGREGLSFKDIRRIVLTHSHEDHCGLAKKVRDQALNAEIFVHEWETGHLFGRLAQDEHRELLLRGGVPAAVFDKMQGLYEEISLL